MPNSLLRPIVEHPINYASRNYVENSIKLSKCQIEIWKDFFCSRQLKNNYYCKICGLNGQEFLRFTTSKMAAPIIKVITSYGIFA